MAKAREHGVGNGRAFEIQHIQLAQPLDILQARVRNSRVAEEYTCPTATIRYRPSLFRQIDAPVMRSKMVAAWDRVG
jgi:hypothetical protein